MAVTNYLISDDRLTGGLGFELGGAFLLARGVSSPRELARNVAYLASVDQRAVSMARDRISSFYGLVAIGVGFALQEVAYFVLIRGHANTPPGHDRADVAAGLMACAIFLTVGLGLVAERKLLRRTLIKMAHYDMVRTLDAPRADMLIKWGEAAGFRSQANEDAEQYLARVFGVTDSYLNLPNVGYQKLSTTPRADWPGL